MDELIERVAKLEIKSEEHSKLLEKQQDKNDAQTEFNAILKMNVEQMKKFGDTLDRVNDNLTNLNINQQQMKVDMSEIGTRVSDIEKHQEDHKIDAFSLIKNLLAYILTAAGGGIVLWIYMKFGIKN